MWLWMLAALAAYFVKGLCGFANTLVFTSILGFGENNISISPVELILSYPSSIILTVRNRSRLNPKVVIPLSLLILCGSIPGTFLLRNIDARYLKITFGFAVVSVGVEMLLRERNMIRSKQSRFLLLLIGFLSGIMCGLFGVGALLAAYIGRVATDSSEFKANINAVFTVENTFRLILYTAEGIITPAALRQALILIPFMLFGLFAGMRSSRKVDEKTAKMLIIVFLILSGIIQIASNI